MTNNLQAHLSIQLSFLEFQTPEEDRSTKKPKAKTLRIGWLHKEVGDRKFQRMKKPLGGVRRLKLDESSVYTAGQIRQMAIDQFADSLEDRYSVQLGLFDGRVLTDFELPNGEVCDLWAYCRAHNKTPYQLNLFILTHPIYVSHADCAGEKLTRSRRRTLIRTGEFVPRDDVEVLFHLARVSKYSGELSCTECRRRDLHAYFLEEQFGDGPAIEQFDPLNHGYSISRIQKNERVLLHIGIEGDCMNRSFHFPSAEADDQQSATDRHVVLHDVDEVQGICDGRFGLGFVPSCTCREATFTWYRDGELYRSGESVYWLDDIELAPGCEASSFYCVVTCQAGQVELKSKEVEVTRDMIDKRLDYPY